MRLSKLDDDQVVALLKSQAPSSSNPVMVAREYAVEEGVLGPRINLPGGGGGDLVSLAAQANAVDLLHCLVLRHGVDPNIENGTDTSLHRGNPLFRTIPAEAKEAALFLIKEVPHINLNARTMFGITPLIATVMIWHDLDVSKALVAAGADVDAQDENEGTALLHAIEDEEEGIAMYLLEEASAAWDKPSTWRLMTAAAEEGLVGVIKAVVRRMRADGLSEEEVTANMAEAASAALEDGEGARFLLATLAGEGFDVTRDVVGGCVGMGLLHDVCGTTYSNNIDVAAYLLQHGCDPLKVDESGMSPLMHAAVYGNPHIVEWLLTTLSIPVDMEGPGHLTALHVAAQHGNLKTVKCLLRARAQPKPVAGTGERPSDMASEKGHAGVARYLREQEAPWDAKKGADPAAPDTSEAEPPVDEEAAARRARNEKRRQRQKKAKARRREAAAAGGAEEAAEEGGADASAAADVEPDEKQEEAEADEMLAPNVSICSLLIGYTEAKTREWEGLERQWQEQQQEGGEGSRRRRQRGEEDSDSDPCKCAGSATQHLVERRR